LISGVGATANIVCPEKALIRLTSQNHRSLISHPLTKTKTATTKS
jgi:hypothetical protein